MTIATLRAQQADYRKMSPWVRQAAASAITTQRQSPTRFQQPQRNITAFVQTNDAQADTLLSKYGCRHYAQLGDIAIATIPLNQLPALSRHPAVRRIEANRPAQTLMDTVPTIVNLLPAYASTAQHQAFTGNGVVVGVMDVGFDLTHPNFYNDTSLSHYRIGALWDQLSQDTIGSAFPVGRDFVGQEAVLGHLHSIDAVTTSHGTHTMGIAAGSGYDSPYRGVAFESDICLVSNAVDSDINYIDSLDLYKYTTATDALGFKYLFDYADQQGKPCVASFSEGYTLGLDQEDSLYAAFLDKLNGPGHIIVAAAGNENNEMTYAEKPRGKEAAGAFIRVFKTEANYRIKADGPTTISLYAYTDSPVPTYELHLSSADPRLDSLLCDTLFADADTCAVSLIRYASSFNPQDTIYVLQLTTNHMFATQPQHIALVAEGADSHVELHGTSRDAFTYYNMAPQWNAAAYGHNILGPGTFPSIITVGSMAYRLGFTNWQGEYQDYSANQPKGKRMKGSSTGPSLTGLMKPDVAAPGYNVISSYSSYYLEDSPVAYDRNNSIARFDVNGRTYGWNANSGTSMACPVVAGTIALWLQAKPTMTREEVMDVLSRTCRHPDETLTYPNHQYGYGEIDAYRGLLDILGISGIKGISLHQPANVRIGTAQGNMCLQFGQVPDAPIKVCVYTVSGKLICQKQLKPTEPEVLLPLPILSSGIYAVQLTSRDTHCTGSQIIRL